MGCYLTTPDRMEHSLAYALIPGNKIQWGVAILNLTGIYALKWVL